MTYDEQVEEARKRKAKLFHELVSKLEMKGYGWYDIQIQFCIWEIMTGYMHYAWARELWFFEDQSRNIEQALVEVDYLRPL